MKNTYYEMIFDCTETLQNGKERTIKKSVLSPIFKDGKHIPELDRIKMAVDVLMKNHYYDIAYLETKKKTLLFVDLVKEGDMNG